ncbi:hypothetical protein B484DRAFT_352105 [Ochromonadaceae sp. CCMP2298]|nr:hypothetical protein B484DRAFT_352105 [Ochromonadaceae sp. CCMP2298]
MSCCCIPGTPVEDPSGRLKTFGGAQTFQRSMMAAPYANCNSFLFCGQFWPCTFGCAQCLLRRKVLGDKFAEKYSCFQGYFDCCCLKAGSCGESSCPTCCAFMEGCCCNCFAVSASRFYVMERYDIGSDPCDYRLIRINNCLQLLSCICSVMAIFCDELRQLAWIINRIADLFYQCVSGCMTAQTAFEVEYQMNHPPSPHPPRDYSQQAHPYEYQNLGTRAEPSPVLASPVLATAVPSAPAYPEYSEGKYP